MQNSVYQLLFARSPPLSVVYLCGPLLYLDAITYENKLLHFHTVDLHIGIYTLILFTILYCF
jgi:hypothetical protein